jgi:hypothetical protein
LATPPNPLGGNPGNPGNGSGMLGTILGALSKNTDDQANPAQDFSQSSAASQGADPSMVLRQLNQIHQMLGVLFVQVFQTVPALANDISQTMKQLTKTIESAKKAANITDTVKNSEQSQGPPIGFSAVQQGQPPTGNNAPSLT